MPDTQTTHEAALQGAFAAGPVRVVPGESGPGLIFRGAAIHDPSSPMEEAALWVNQALGVNSRGEPPKLALVFGLGLGWHIRRLHELFPGIKVAVFEPDKGVIPVFEKYNALSRGQEPKIFLDFERFASLVAQEMVHCESGFPVVLTVPG